MLTTEEIRAYFAGPRVADCIGKSRRQVSVWPRRIY